MDDKILEQRKIEAEIRQAAEEGRTELDFRFRKFLELPKSILEIKGLKRLDLFDCGITIPAWLSQITTLEELYVSDTHGIDALFPTIHELRNLRVLKMGYAVESKSLPDTFGLLEKLEVLNLSGADFTTFPQCIGELKNLRALTFKFCWCDPDEVFDVLSRLPNLKELRIVFSENSDKIYESYEDAMMNCGFDMPPSLLKLSHLEVLDLHDYFALRSLPENIHELRHLKKLNLKQDMHNGGMLEHLPASLFDIPSFEHLDITYCYNIVEFPSSILHWRSPKVLRCFAAGVTSFPDFSREQKALLEELSWSGPLPDLSFSPHLKKLSLYNSLCIAVLNKPTIGTGCAYKYDIPKLPELEEFAITGGFLADTDFLLNFPRLKRLRLHCEFQNLPEQIGKLRDLEEIRLYGVREMKRLPASFSELRSLKSLSFCSCSLWEVPQNLGLLENLEKVELDDITGMVELSEEWYSLPALKSLSITNCSAMRKMPNGISRLSQLEYLELCGNTNLALVPTDFCNLKKLHSLEWMDNGEGLLPEIKGLESHESYEL